jgi:GPH family glycoside/pentoside/hexuronide:cation symporter
MISKSKNMIPMSTKVMWGAGACGVAFLLNVVAFWALFYMTNVLKIDPLLAGVVVFLPKIFDAITDPLVGTISDRMKWANGRRRPFLLVGAILAPLSFLMIFTTPIFESEWMTAGYVFIGLMIYSLAYTIYNIPYLAMPSEMTDDYHERTSIHSVRVVYYRIAGLIGGVGLPLMLNYLGMESWSTYAYLGVFGAIFIFIMMFTAWAGTKNARFTQAQDEQPNMFSEIAHVFSNKHFIRLILVKFCQLIGVASTIAAFSYFAIYVLSRDFTVLSLYGAVAAIVGIISAPVFVAMSKRFGKSRTYTISALFYVVGVLSWAFTGADSSLTSICLRAIPIGFAASGNVILAMSMLTDIINYDSKLNSVRREGVFTSFYTFTEKLTFAFGPLIIGAALKMAGFDAELPTEELRTPQVRQALLLGMAYVPAVFGLLSIFLLMGYKLKQEDLE